MSQEEPTNGQTQHAMLVAWGMYARQIGLIGAIEQVKVKQKTRDHSPNRKVLEFMVGILGGIKHLQDISHSAHPIDQDQTLARAWGQESWADYSGVSRTLSSLSQPESEALVKGLQQVSQPFLDQEVLLCQREQGCLIYDGDLTGRPISNSCESYPGAAYGYMGDQVQLGYQAAMVSMHSPSYGRQWLVVQPHPGDKVACNQLQQMVLEAEQVSGVRPQRRLEYIAQSLEQAEQAYQQCQLKWEQAATKLAQTQNKHQQVEQQCWHWQTETQRLEIAYCQAGRPERPHSALAKARQKMAIYQKRLARLEQRLDQDKKRSQRLQIKYQHALRQWQDYQTHYLKCKADNAHHPNPVRIIFRLDAGFGTKENIAWLIEMGYEIYTKPYSHRLVNWLKNQVSAQANWVSVGQNAQMIAWTNKILNQHPYPLNVAVARYQTGDTFRYTAFLHFGPDPVTADLPAWFQTYNARQTIEAGIKEGKGVFQMHHLKVRSPPALYLQEHFAAFAANFVRWAAGWLAQQPKPDLLPVVPQLRADTPSVKHLVQVAAHASAQVFWHQDSCLIVFSDHSCYRGHALLLSNLFYFQLPLPLFQVSDDFY